MADLLQTVLDGFAKEKKIESKPENRVWARVPRNYCFSKADVERFADLALEATAKEIAKEIQKIPLGEEGSVYNGAVKIFKDVFGTHPFDILKPKKHFVEVAK